MTDYPETVIIGARHSDGTRPRFHAPRDGDEARPGCSTGERDVGTTLGREAARWRSVERRVVEPTYSPCQHCFGDVDQTGPMDVVDCPLCGERVKMLSRHLPHCDQERGETA